MKIWRNALIYLLLLFTAQGGTMYLLLRVWHESFFLSAFVAACATTGVMFYAGRWLGIGPTI